MTAPDTKTLFDALDATWPAAHVEDNGPFRLRDGEGGGQRVSSAVALGAATDQDITDAEDAMRAKGQHPLFMLRPGDEDLDAALAARGYAISDPTRFFWIAPDTIARRTGPGLVFPSWPPFAAQRELWAEAGIGPARLDVMERVKGPKNAILCRIDDTPAATFFIAIFGKIAMLHALEVLPRERHRGLGEDSLRAAAVWAQDQGAEALALAVTEDNLPATALYEKLGMHTAAGYHYRRAAEADR